MSSCQSAEDKLRWAFRMYDKDGSGEQKKFSQKIFCLGTICLSFLKRNNRHGGDDRDCDNFLQFGGGVQGGRYGKVGLNILLTPLAWLQGWGPIYGYRVAKFETNASGVTS